MRLAVVWAAGLVCSSVLAAEPVQRTLSFEERVSAQTAIERVYYSHQVGATKPFEAAVPRAVIEAKVRKYLEQSAALNLYWKTPVTDYSLQRELERMAQGTRMPERLQELYASLGNDAFLVKECLARATLVDRLTHNFYAFDPTLHAQTRAQAEELHRLVVAGELSASMEHPNRTVSEIVVGAALDQTSPAVRPTQERLPPDEFKKQRVQLPARVGEVSELEETRDAFTFNVVLSETATEVRVASYVVHKITWDAWWAIARSTVLSRSVRAVASGSVDLPPPREGRPVDPRVNCADDYWENGILDDVVPDPRTQHVAVWTGSQMIVWGGGRNWDSLQSGGRYDPATDTWTPTSLNGAPVGRFLATAVWSGSQMVVWGGNLTFGGFGGDPLNSGGRYDPVSDSWTPTTGRGAPTPRSGHTAVWTGNRMVVWGGRASRPGSYPSDTILVNSGGQYDPVADRWTPTSTLGAPSARSRHTAVWTGDLMVVWGGGSTLASGGRYDPATDRWTPTSFFNVPQGRGNHSAVWTGTEMIVWGGLSYTLNDPNCPPAGTCYFNVSTGGRYDPASDSWVATSTLGAPSARGGQTALWTGSLMIVWGRGDYNNYTDTGGRYDPATDTWSPTSLAGAPTQREFQTAVWTGSQMVIWGGDTHMVPNQLMIPLNTGGRYDPIADSWTPTDTTIGPASPPQTAVWTGNLMVVWAGGGSGERYDPVNDSLTPVSQIGAPSGRYGHSAVWTGELMVVWGGDEDRNSVNTGGRYNPVSDGWSPTSESGAPSGRALHTAVWTGTSMVIWGGYSYEGTYHDLSTGGRYDPASDEWTPMSELDAPSGREQHTAVWTGNSMVVWGGGVPDIYGRIDQGVNTGGRYDPTADTWAPTSITNVPSGRYGHTAVWTGSLMIVWGGRAYSYGPGTGGRYDTATDSWTATSTAFAPNSRYAHSAVWQGNLMVVWGGYGTDGPVYLDRTGARYDPIADGWSPISETGRPTVRAQHSAIWTGTSMIVRGGEFVAGYGGGGQYFPGTVMDVDCDGDGITGYAGDCDDHNPSVYPGAAQICDGINDDCSDPYWPQFRYDLERDADGDGFLACRDDCDDTNASVYPGAPQICDGVNDDCSDPGWPAVAADEADQDGDDARVCAGDCDDTRWYVGPGFYERCNGRDDDCNGLIDDGTAAASCDDRNPCTDDACNGRFGCSYANNTVPCDDFNPCTLNDVCDGGSCRGAIRTGEECDDGYACTTDDRCDARADCKGHSACDDGNPCTWDVTDPLSCNCDHYPADFASCDDGDPCTPNGGYCYPDNSGILTCHPDSVRDACDDHNPCTDDSCDSAVGCIHLPNDANACNDDGDVCSQTHWCSAGVCVGSNPISCGGPSCPPGSTAVNGGCAVTHTLDWSSLDNLDRQCQYEGWSVYNCYEGAYGFHWMDSRGALGAITHVELQFRAGLAGFAGSRIVTLNGSVIGEFSANPNYDCPAPDVPIDFADVPVAAYAPSGMNQVLIFGDYDCEGVNAIDSLNGIFAQVIVTRQWPGDSCSAGSCEPRIGCNFTALPDGAACSDTDTCTVGDACFGGACLGTPIEGSACDDGNPCTINDRACDGGPCHGTALNCDDGNPCNGLETCNPVTGCGAGNPVTCDDADACTDDDCDPALGCVHTNNTAPCDDGNVCTGTDVCEGGLCHGTPLNGTPCEDYNPCTVSDSCFQGVCQGTDPCDDGNPCTVDDCSNTGCYHQNISGSCDDGNLCTVEDRCVDGTCAGTVRTCDDDNPCTDDSCDPAAGCLTADNTEPCDDRDLCTQADSCAGGTCHGGAPVVCENSNPCTTLTCQPDMGCVSANNASSCNDGNACTTGDICGDGYCHSGPLTVCSDDNVCTTDTCDPASGCAFVNNSNVCDDGNACTTGDRCLDGLCGTPVVCDDGNRCTTDSCDPATGCVATNNASSCNDGNACTLTDVCANGACVGSSPVVCAALDQCHDSGACDPGTGACSSPAKLDGTACNDDNLCTTGETCHAGACTPASSGLSEPNPRSNGYYKRLCHGSHSGDSLTDADATCVASVAHTFAGISTVADLCAELEPSHPNSDPCDRAEDDLMVLALNICRARVCTAQRIDSECGDSANVGQSLAESDGILGSSSRTAATCARAKCLDEEINTGAALELNSLALTLDTGYVRLSWSPPFLNDGTGHPGKYSVWRRPQGSVLPFRRIAETTGTTYLDTILGVGAFAYEVTAVMD